MAIRLLILLALGGIVLLVMGASKYRLSRGCEAEPDRVSLRELEDDPDIENAYLEIGPHKRLYRRSIFRYEGDTDRVTARTKLTTTWYPIVPMPKPRPPVVRNGRMVPPGPPEIQDWDRFVVLVKTKRFETAGDIPARTVSSDSIRGVVVNEVEQLGSEEKDLLLEEFPDVDMATVLILDEGREPPSAMLYMPLMGGGVLLFLAAAGVGLWRARQSPKEHVFPAARPPAPQPPTPPQPPGQQSEPIVAEVVDEPPARDRRRPAHLDDDNPYRQQG